MQRGEGFRIAKSRHHRRTARRTYVEPWLLTSGGGLEALEPPLHVAADEWAATLDDVGEASGFESNLELFLFEARTGRQTGHQTGRQTWSAAARQESNAIYTTRITASGDTRIWHRKVEDWVRTLLPKDETSEELQAPVLRHRTDLVEALMSHGILRDNDLRVLSEGRHSSPTSHSRSEPPSPPSPGSPENDESFSPQTSIHSYVLEQDHGSEKMTTERLENLF